MADAMLLGAKVRALRRREHMTQVDLAERLGVSASYLNLIENNRRPLTAPLLIRLALSLLEQIYGIQEVVMPRLGVRFLVVCGDNSLLTSIRCVGSAASSVG